jgi:predicted Zn-dependent protease
VDEHGALSPSELFLLETWVGDNPGSRQFLRLARAYLDLGRLEDAGQVLSRGLTLNPHEIAARRLWAQALVGLGRPEAALEQLLLAAQERASHAEVYEQLAELLAGQGRAAEANQARALARDLARGFSAPESDAAAPAANPDTVTLAEIYAGQGLTSQAAEIYRRLLAKNPHDPDLRRRMGEAGRRFVEAERSLEAFRERLREGLGRLGLS